MADYLDGASFSTTKSYQAGNVGYTETVSGPIKQCEFGGHRVDKWAEYLDGVCVGYCTECNERVTSTRPPGGLPFLRLKALVETLISMPGEAEPLVELNDIEVLLDLEQQSMNEARSLLGTARKMSGCYDE